MDAQLRRALKLPSLPRPPPATGLQLLLAVVGPSGFCCLGGVDKVIPGAGHLPACSEQGGGCRSVGKGLALRDHILPEKQPAESSGLGGQDEDCSSGSSSDFPQP